jgi:hypothetical protein
MDRKVVAKSLALIMLGSAGAAWAIPQLQLTVEDGTYNSGTQTTDATTNPFTLYALLTPQGGCDAACVTALLADTYYISMAVVPQTGPAAANLGSFTYNGITVNVTGDMKYGVPPLETVATLQGFDNGDLATHGIYETFFTQIGFTFDRLVSTTPADVQTNPNYPPSSPLVDNDGGMYFVPFLINVSGLTGGTQIHFDLYSSAVVSCGNNPNCVAGDIDVNDFAPNSHDAQSGSSSSSSSSSSSNGGGGGSSSNGIPEPGTLTLFGAGILGGLFAYRRRRQIAA